MLTWTSARFFKLNDPSLDTRPITRRCAMPARYASTSPLVAFTLSVLLGGCDSLDSPDASISHAQQGVLSAALSQDGARLALGSINHGASLWETGKNERLFNWNHEAGEYTQITRVRFSDDEAYVLTAEPQQLVLWSTANGEGDALWTTYSEILDAAVLSGGEFAVLGLADNTAKLFDLRQGGTRQIYSHGDRVNSVDVHSESSTLASASDDRTAKLWKISAKTSLDENGEIIPPEPIATLSHKEPVQLIRLSDDGALAFTMAQYDAARVWTVADGKPIGSLPLGNFAKKRGTLIRSARFSPDNTRLLTGSADRHIMLWDVKKLELLRQWKAPKRRGMDPQGRAVLDIAFNADGTYSAVTSDGTRHQLL